MEARRITIVQTKNQKKSVIMTSASTLGELKDDLRTNGIDYEGMTFYEGLSKTELKADESILPHDIERNGTVTNELVFMLTNTQKKIRSGATSRGELYNEIKTLNLQDVCKRTYGRNFTQCSTQDLIHLIETHKQKATARAAAPVVEEKKAEAVEAPKAEVATPNCSCGCNTTKAAVEKLVDFLVNNYTIEPDEANEVLGLLHADGEVVLPTIEQASKNECPYSDDEINKMFRGM